MNLKLSAMRCSQAMFMRYIDAYIVSRRYRMYIPTLDFQPLLAIRLYRDDIQFLVFYNYQLSYI